MGWWMWIMGAPAIGGSPGAVLVPQIGHLDSVRQVALHPTGSHVASAGRDGAVVLWHVASGAMLERFEVDDDVLAVGFADDGDHVVAATARGGWFTWDTGSGELVEERRLLDDDAEWRSARFVEGGRRLLAVTEEGAALVKDNGRRRRTMDDVEYVRSQSATPDGRFVAARVDDEAGAVVGVFKGRSGKRIASLVVGEDAERFATVAMSPDGRRVVTTDDTASATVWSARSGERLATLQLDAGRHVDAGFGPGGEVYTMDERSTFRRWDGEAVVQTIATRAYVDRGFVVGEQGRFIVAPTFGRGVAVWSLADGELVAAMRGSVRPPTLVTASFDEFAVGHGDGTVSLWSAVGGDLRRVYEIGRDPVEQILLHRNHLLLGLTKQDVKVFDTSFGSNPVFALEKRSGRLEEANLDFMGRRITIADPFEARAWEVSRFHSAPFVGERTDWGTVRANGEAFGKVSKFEARPDHRPLPPWLALERGGLFVVDPETGARRASLYMFDDGNWAVVDPEGRFDTGDPSLDGLRWVIDGRPYDLAQLRDRYYEPGLLAKLLGHNDEPLRKVPPLSAVEAPPVVHLTGPSPDGVLTVRIEDRGSGFGGVFATLNGSDITADVEAACPDLGSGEPCTLSLVDRPTWMPGRTNVVRVEGFSASGVLRSRALDVAVTAAGEALEDAPDLWVLLVGSGDYRGDDLDLKYASHDANRLARALAVAGTRGFGADRTHLRLLSTAPGDGVHGTPSKDALREGFGWLAQSDPLDTVIVYFSGHGVAFTDGPVDDYFYLLPDAASIEDVRDPSRRPLHTFSGDELAEAMAEVPALKRVVVLDTCAAGKIDAELAAERAALSSDVIRAHARSRERTGAWLLAGAAADKVSYEASRFGQGVLTYALIEGMLGPALDDADLLMVSRWLSWAETQVPRHAAGIGGVQEPVTRRGSAADFPLGQLPPEDRQRIPLRKVRPVVVGASVVGRGGRQDTLRCTEAIDARLREISDDDTAPFVHWDSDPIARTWQITGTCVEGRDGIAFDGFLTLTGETAGQPTTEVAVQARGADPRAVAQRVVARAAQVVGP